MKQLIIDENKWACAFAGKGQSALLNDEGNMCCLGFYAKSRGYTDENIRRLGTLSSLIGSCPSKEKNLPKKIFKKEKSNGGSHHYDPSWELGAVEINDDTLISRKSRKLRLIAHFKKINVKLVFTKSKKT